MNEPSKLTERLEATADNYETEAAGWTPHGHRHQDLMAVAALLREAAAALEQAENEAEGWREAVDELARFANYDPRIRWHMGDDPSTLIDRMLVAFDEGWEKLAQAERRSDANHGASQDDAEVSGLAPPREARQGGPALLPSGTEAPERSDDVVRVDPRPDGFLAEKVENQRRHLNKLQRKYETVKGQLRLELAKLEQAEKALREIASGSYAAQHNAPELAREALAALGGQAPWDESHEGVEADRPEDLPFPKNADKRWEEPDGG